jgi:hypothetical protein
MMVGYLDKKERVSLEVLKLFINMNLTLNPNSFLMLITCFAVRSRKVLLPFTFNKDLALSKPIEVPRPPLSFKTTVFYEQREGEMLRGTRREREGTEPGADLDLVSQFL